MPHDSEVPRAVGLNQKVVLKLESEDDAGDGLCTSTMTLLAGAAVDNVYCTEPGVPLEKMSQRERFS